MIIEQIQSEQQYRLDQNRLDSHHQPNKIAIEYLCGQSKYTRLRLILKQPWAMLLDSGTKPDTINSSDSIAHRAYDICVCEPLFQLTSQEGETWLTRLEPSYQQKPSRVKQSLTALPMMRQHIQDYQSKLTGKMQSTLKQLKELPFSGGWLGYISYDWSKQCAFDQAKIKQCDADNLLSDNDTDSPSASKQFTSLKMGFYTWAIISDHKNRTSHLYNFALPADQWDSIAADLLNKLEMAKTPPQSNQGTTDFQLTEKFHSNLSYQQYQQDFKQIKKHIQQGNCYQINYTRQFTAGFKGDSFAIYQYLAELNNAPFSAYLNFGKQQILCLSPERFIQSRAGKVSTHPIKGTMPRSQQADQDSINAQILANSAKDRAENLMIVDLMRNDLSKTAAKASVKVSQLYELYSFESVHHLVSTVESKLSSNKDIYDLLSTTLPGGSITGAPKLTAMQIIEALETQPRGIYCGNILYMDFNGNLDSNICIRTLLLEDQTIFCWAGGGIVADSKMEQEFQEALAKLAKIIPPLEKKINHNLSDESL